VIAKGGLKQAPHRALPKQAICPHIELRGVGHCLVTQLINQFIASMEVSSLCSTGSSLVLALSQLLNPILIFPSNLPLGLPSGLFLSHFPTTNSWALLVHNFFHACSAHLIFFKFISLILFSVECRLLTSSSCGFHYPPVIYLHLGPFHSSGG
jgi:hypothetical protein